MFIELWENIFKLFDLLCTFGNVVTDLFTSTLRSIVDTYQWNNAVINSILNFQILNVQLGDISAMNLLFGVGIPIWFISAWIKFFKDTVA